MKVKNITKEELMVPNVGIIKPGAIVEVPEDFHNINFERVENKKTKEE